MENGRLSNNYTKQTGATTNNQNKGEKEQITQRSISIIDGMLGISAYQQISAQVTSQNSTSGLKSIDSIGGVEKDGEAVYRVAKLAYSIVVTLLGMVLSSPRVSRRAGDASLRFFPFTPRRHRMGIQRQPLPLVPLSSLDE